MLTGIMVDVPTTVSGLVLGNYAMFRISPRLWVASFLTLGAAFVELQYLWRSCVQPQSSRIAQVKPL